jgi:hypothetical protein
MDGENSKKNDFIGKKKKKLDLETFLRETDSKNKKKKIEEDEDEITPPKYNKKSKKKRIKKCIIFFRFRIRI